jgi:uncharacterized protein YecT (DUF1311 family)
MAVPTAYAIEDGDSCSSSTKLPTNFTCFDRKIYDCRSPQGLMGYVACGEQKQKRLETEMNLRYQRLLKLYVEGKSENGENFDQARASLIKSQSAWRQLADADCDLEDSLLGTGNSSAGIMSDCRIGHIQQRILRLKQLGQ